MPDIYRLRLKMMLDSKPIYTYFHLNKIGAAAKAKNLVDLWVGAGSTEWSQFSFMLSQNVKLIDVEAAEISNGGVDYNKQPAAATLFGALNGPSLPLTNCLRITWKTAIHSRRTRGWTFISGVSANRTTAGFAQTVYISNIQQWINNFLGRYGPSGSGVNWRFGIYSRACGGYYPNANPACWTQITQGSVDPGLTRCEKKGVDKAAQFEYPYL